MKELYELMMQKEADIARVRHEIDVLRAAAAIIEKVDDSDMPHPVDDWRPPSQPPNGGRR